jgi:MFS family permease
LNAPALLVFGAVASPFMGPLIGLSLATLVGSARFFWQVLAGAIVGSLLMLSGGVLAGYVSRFWPGQPFSPDAFHIQLTWPGLIVLAFGICLVAFSLVHSEQKPVLPSTLVTYSLYIPLVAAGFGISTAQTHLIREGLGLFAIYLACSVLFGTIALALQGFRPMSFFGYTIGTTLLLVSIIILVGASGFGTLMIDRLFPVGSIPPAASEIGEVLSDTATIIPTTQPTATGFTPLPSETPTPLQSTRTPTRTLVPSATSTITLTPVPTPVWAIVTASNGVYVRSKPSGASTIVTTVEKGGLVKVLPDTIKEGLTTWVHIITPEGIEGWVIQSVLVTATPSPTW